MTASLGPVPEAAPIMTTTPSSAEDALTHPAVSGAEVDVGLLVVEERFSIVPEWVLDADVSDAAIRLYAVLLRFGASSGQRMPSRRTLAERLRKKSVDSVDRALRELVRVGAVEVSRRTRDGVNLTNRYLVRSTPPGTQPSTSTRSGLGRGGRRSAATPCGGARQRRGLACEERDNGDVSRGGGGRISAATPGRKSAAGVAARMRPNREFFTETNPPPRPPSAGSPQVPGREERRDARQPGDALPVAGGGRSRAATVLELLGLDTLDEVAAECARLRRQQALPATLWTTGRLTQVLAAAVLDAGWPASFAVPALLAVAADPSTRSPARLSCPGPWWDTAARRPEPRQTAEGREDDLAVLEGRLAETDGRRVLLQRLARAELAAEGQQLTRALVVRRAVDILDRHTHDDRDGTPSRMPSVSGAIEPLPVRSGVAAAARGPEKSDSRR